MNSMSYMSNIRPSHRQIQWQETEFYGFVHFGMNTFTDSEWGPGNVSPKFFDPDNVDTDQWMRTLKSAGMRGVILTAKHHDGFCLWPSLETDYSVAASAWKAGKGDLVREVADAARSHGLKFGLYLSPWDRHESCYGMGAAYDDFYVAQLVELLTGYGPIFSVWLDGANGEGAGGKVQMYDWDRYYRTIRALQPNAAISVCGPDVRWCGNEAGQTRPEEWSVVPLGLRDVEGIASRSQQFDDRNFSRRLSSDLDDLGSRTALSDCDDELCWYPAEVNTSIRPGWFYHESEDGEVRTADELFDIYLRSVGGNATFLLNVPPDRRGRIADTDVSQLQMLGNLIGDFWKREVPAKAEYSSGTVDDGVWTPVPEDRSPTISLRFAEATVIEALVLCEDICQGQRVEEVRIEAEMQGRWVVVASGATVGYQRIFRFPKVATEEIRVVIPQVRQHLAIRKVAAIKVG